MRDDAVASAPGAAGTADGRARRGASYFVPLGLELEPLELVPELELPVVLPLGVVVDGGVVVDAGGVVVDDDGGAVEGDADGERSPGRSPRRSLRDSEQPVIRPALSASTQAPVSSFFIFTCLPVCGCSASSSVEVQRPCPPP